MLQKEEIERRKQFILINHWFMTNKEMADELGIDPSTVISIGKKLVVTGITLKERVIEYIKEHPESSQQHIIDKFGVTDITVYSYCKECGIELMNNREVKKAPDPHKGIASWPKESREYISSVTGWKEPAKSKIIRPKW